MGLTEIDWGLPTRVRMAPGFPNILVAHLSVAPKPYCYVGRAMPGIPASPLGNPFRPGPGVDAIERFRQWLRDAYRAVSQGRASHEQREAVMELRRLADLYRAEGGLNLACWCSPDPCHADVVAEAVIGLVAQTDPVSVLVDGAGICCVVRNPNAPAAMTWQLYHEGHLLRQASSFAAARAPIVLDPDGPVSEPRRRAA